MLCVVFTFVCLTFVVLYLFRLYKILFNSCYGQRKYYIIMGSYTTACITPRACARGKADIVVDTKIRRQILRSRQLSEL